MRTEDNKQIGVLYFNEMWNKSNFTLAEEIIDPLFNPEWMNIDAIGPSKVIHEIKYFRSIFPDLKYEIIEIVGEEDKVWVRYKGYGTHKGKAFGFEPTDKKVEFEGASIIYINSNRRVIDLWDAFSFYDLFVDLGIIPPFWEIHKFL